MGTAELLIGVEECTGKPPIGQCIYSMVPLGEALPWSLVKGWRMATENDTTSALEGIPTRFSLIFND